MGLLGRLLGKSPPRVPAGGRAFTSQDDLYGKVWTIRVVMPGQDPTPQCPRLKGSPSFTKLPIADAYLDWVTGAASSFSYPAGEA